MQTLLVQHHDALFDHTIINIEDYKREANKLQVKNCTKHTDEAYIGGCAKCFDLICKKGLHGLGICKEGKQKALI